MDRILIVAQRGQGAAVKEMLADEGYSFVLAESGDQARGLAEDVGCDFGAVILDCSMDRSMELLEWFKSHETCQDIEVIVHSPKHVPERIRHGIELGAYYHLTQPFEPLQLRALVRAAIASRQLKRSLATKISETQDCFRLLSRGVFEIQTPSQAELLAAHLGSACGDPQKGVGLLELILNGIEHGNLGIGYEEKTRLLGNGRYEEELEIRLTSPQHRDKRVLVELQRVDEELQIDIRDQGAGFDHRRYSTVDAERFFDSHGRGVLLASAILDVEYLDAGNRVRVRLPLAPANGSESGGEAPTVSRSPD